MKHLLLLAVIIGIFFTCSHAPTAGTSDDVHSGTITGKLLTDGGKLIDDTVTVSLYVVDTTGDPAQTLPVNTEPHKSKITSDGNYTFDSLIAGIYRVAVTKDSIVVGDRDSIVLDTNKIKTTDITIVIIINQTFNIWTDKSKHITINNFYIENGKIVLTDSGYVLTTAESDTLDFDIEIEKDGKTSVVKIRIVRHDDGTTAFEVLEGSDEVTVTPGVAGQIGDITIDIEEPGSIKIESTFDTSGVPTRSK